MDDEHNPTRELSKGDQPPLAVIEAVILEGDAFSLEDERRIREAQSVLLDVEPIFLFIPFTAHSIM
jgi:hypothetical protein